MICGMRLISWIEFRPPRQQVAAEGSDGYGGDSRSPQGEEKRSGVED
jgi:hypothetical protein